MSENKDSRELSNFRGAPRYVIERDAMLDAAMNDESAQDNVGLRYLFRIALKYRELILGAAAALIILTIIHSIFATRIYRAEAILKIGTYAPLLANAGVEDVLRQQTRETDYVNTQTEQLQSLSLADNMLKLPGTGESIKGYLSKKTGIFSVFEPLFALLRSKDEEKEKPNASGYQHKLPLLKKYLDLVSISPIRKTSLVRVSVDTSDPELSAQVANLHAEQFVALVRAERQKTAVENLVFLKTQAQELGEKVAAQERALAAYAEENEIVALNKDENVTVKRMSELNQLLTAATAKRIRSETTYNEAKSGSGVNSAAYDDKTVLDVRVSLEQAESEYSQLSQKFKPGYPQMKQLASRIASLKKNLESQRRQVMAGLKATYLADVESEKALKEQLEQQQSKTFDLSRREVQYNIMKREYDSTKDLQQSILRQLKEAQVSSESSGTNISLSDRAAPPLAPSSPRPVRNILIALVVGLLGGFGIALLLDLLDNTYTTPEEIQSSLGLPVLGVVPIFGSEITGISRTPGDEGAAPPAPIIRTGPGGEIIELPVAQASIVTFDNPMSIASEAFRTIRTGILLSSADKQPRVILVTSGKKSEGKTTLATNLGAALCQNGHRVLLIDADLRRPAIHKSFDMEGKPVGLVGYLTGTATLESIIVPSSINGLYLIPAGATPPNPAELVGSQRMADLLELLREGFDYVVVDAPPLLPVTDAMLLSRFVDGVVLVVRGEDTPKHVVREASQKLRKSGAKILGVVLNDVDIRRGDYYYYYRDSYSYYEPDVERKRRPKSASA